MSENSELLRTLDEVEGQTDEVQPGTTRRRASALRPLARLTLGGSLIALEALTDWLRQLDQEPIEATAESRPVESVLIPADEWETTLGYEVRQPPRHVLLGFALDSQSRLSRTASAILRQGDRVVGTVDRVLNPVLSSRALSPVRGPFESLVERGQAQVNHWRELGRAEEARSRVLTRDATEQLIDASVNTVSSDPRAQEMVQVIIQQQGLGMLDEAVEEVRERTITGDMLLERPVRAILRRRPRESLSPPTEIRKNLPRLSAKGR